jgi:hypothetical protein
MMRLVNREGVDTTAAFGATQQLWTYVQMPAMALGAAVSAMAAQNIGAGKWDRVSSITRIGTIYAVLMTGALVLLLLVADRQALQIFLGAESPAIAIGRHIGQIATWGFIAFGVTMVLFGTVRANARSSGRSSFFSYRCTLCASASPLACGSSSVPMPLGELSCCHAVDAADDDDPLFPRRLEEEFLPCMSTPTNYKGKQHVYRKRRKQRHPATHLLRMRLSSLK